MTNKKQDNDSYGVSEWLKKTFGELSPSKEAILTVLSQAEKTKQEATKVISTELRQFLNNLEISKLLKNALVGTTLKINAEIEIKDNANDSHKISIENKKTTVRKKKAK